MIDREVREDLNFLLLLIDAVINIYSCFWLGRSRKRKKRTGGKHYRR